MYKNMCKDSSAKYYQNNKERLQEMSLEKYRSFFQRKKPKKLLNGRIIYKNLSENNKQKLVKYRKKYYEMRKNKNILQKKTD